MIIKNPTKNDIEVMLFGVKYFIEAEGTLENVPEKEARYWQEMLHSFLVLRKDKEVVPEIVVQTPKVEAVVGPEVTQDAASENLPVPEQVVDVVTEKATKTTSKK